MNAKNIQVGHVYFVDFNPVRKKEFDKNHLAIVLKKNSNKITFVVIPLTSNEEGVNKLPLGILEGLPERLKGKQTFAVVDQVRTLNASRFQNIIENEKVLDVSVNDVIMKSLYKAVIKDLLYDFKEGKGEFLQELAIELTVQDKSSKTECKSKNAAVENKSAEKQKISEEAEDLVDKN